MGDSEPTVTNPVSPAPAAENATSKENENKNGNTAPTATAGEPEAIPGAQKEERKSQQEVEQGTGIKVKENDSVRAATVSCTNSVNGNEAESAEMHGVGVWMDVALTNTTRVEAVCAYKNNALFAVAQKDGFVNLHMEDFEKGMELEPAKVYKFRVAAVNTMGVGAWSEVTAYRTLDPGLPGAPNTVKVNKSDNGGTIVSWEAPGSSSGTILEYAVFLAVNGGGNTKVPSFQRVYLGTESFCHVTKSQLQQAVIDNAGGRSAVIFRIAAKNDRGFGPATQVRWLQGT